MLAAEPSSANKAAQLASCGGCGCNTRRRGSNGEPLCRTCSLKDRTCMRCGKALPRATKTLAEGAVCGSCVTYYKEPKPCPVCGQMSLRLSRNATKGFSEQPVCEHCQRKGNITCAGCGKNRHPAGTRTDGKPICKSCLERGDNPFVCETCGKEGKPHSKVMCQACYWSKRADKRFKDSVALLSHEWAREAFRMFYNDLIARQDPHAVATTKLERYFLFFAKLDSAFEDPAAITAEHLIASLGADGLRRHAVPYSFLAKEKIIPEIAHESLEESSEHRRQKLILDQAKDAWYGSLLERFYRHLEKINERYATRGWKGKRRRFVPRTVTADLRAASVFLEFLNKEQHASSLQQVQQPDLDRFLAENNGYRTGIRAFLRYLNREEKLFRKLSQPSVASGLPEGVFLSRAKYEELLRAWLSPSEETLKESLVCALMLLYAQPANRIVRIRLSDMAHGRDGLYRLAMGRTEIALDRRLGEMLGRYLEQRRALATMEDAENNEYLFAGRTYGGHLTEAAVTYYLNKHGVSAGQLFSTAIYNAYMGGLRHPKVLVNAFGISVETAIKYLNIIDPQLVQEINQKVAHV